MIFGVVKGGVGGLRKGVLEKVQRLARTNIYSQRCTVQLREGKRRKKAHEDGERR